MTTTEASMFSVVTYPARPFRAAYGKVIGTLPVSGRRVEIDVHGPEPRFGSETNDPATVNWSGIGSVCMEDALAYAEAIRLAAAASVLLAGPTGEDA